MAAATDVQTLTREILVDLKQGAQEWANSGHAYLFEGKRLALAFCTLGQYIVVSAVKPVPPPILTILEAVEVYSSTPHWTGGTPSYFDHDGHLRIECFLPISYPVELRFDLPTG